ncbi:MAG: ABC transporter ATP-binding protein [Candidatus Faecousia sp.]|nr:ABC transporter ATP-binding protein [Candidatus Faecousia sp.]
MTTRDYQRKSPLSIFLHYFGNHKALFVVDILCAVGIAAIDLTFPLVTRKALYDLLPNQLYRTFFLIMLAVAGSYLLRTFLNYIVAYYGHTFGIRVEADIRADLFAHMQELSFDYYDRNRTGKLMARLTTDLFELTELAHHGPEDLLTSGLTILGALAVMLSVRWELALVVALTIPVFLAVAMAMRRRMARASAAAKEKTGHINQEIESSLSGVRTAKAFANEEAEISRFDAANEVYKTSKREFHKAMGLFHSSVEFFLCMLNVIIVGFGGYYVMRGQMDYRDLITFNLYIASFVNPMRKLCNFSELFANGFAGLNRFVEVMRTEPTVQDKPDAKELENVKGKIDISHVSFAYDGDLAVLHDVTMQVRPGETIAIVGPSGGGKTTLCQLIPRFYDVTSGSISIDGLDIRDVTQRSLHESIGIVQQDVFLFADTVFENIRYGRPDATLDEVKEAARKAEIYDDIMAMPNGFQTYVGERGTLLSGGQKQRIAIARIFLKNPPILILDEATSALDSVTEAKIQRAFDNLAKGRTTLIIAHRLSTIRSASRIVSIADGVITECGTHAELLETGGIYSQLYKTQNALALDAMKEQVAF